MSFVFTKEVIKFINQLQLSTPNWVQSFNITIQDTDRVIDSVFAIERNIEKWTKEVDKSKTEDLRSNLESIDQFMRNLCKTTLYLDLKFGFMDTRIQLLILLRQKLISWAKKIQRWIKISKGWKKELSESHGSVAREFRYLFYANDSLSDFKDFRSKWMQQIHDSLREYHSTEELT